MGTSKSLDGTGYDADLWRMPFKESIAEDFISTRWFIKRYRELSSKQVPGVKDISESYGSDIHSKIVFEEFADNLAQFSIELIKLFQPDVIVIGGNIMKAWQFFLPQISQKFKHLNIQIPIKRAMLNENAAILGAGSIWLNGR